MESFVKLLNGKLPKDNIHSGMILGIIRDERIKDKQQLMGYLQNQELLCREWLAKNKGAAMNSKRRGYTRKLEEIKNMRSILERI